MSDNATTIFTLERLWLHELSISIFWLKSAFCCFSELSRFPAPEVSALSLSRSWKLTYGVGKPSKQSSAVVILITNYTWLFLVGMGIVLICQRLALVVPFYLFEFIGWLLAVLCIVFVSGLHAHIDVVLSHRILHFNLKIKNFSFSNHSRVPW